MGGKMKDRHIIDLKWKDQDKFVFPEVRKMCDDLIKAALMLKNNKGKPKDETNQGGIRR